MKRQFKDINFRPASLATIEKANEIIEDYEGQGLKLTLRQLYYQFVSKNLIPNTERSYKNLGSLISDGRLAGLVDWDAIEDRNRAPAVPSEWPDLDSLVRSAVAAYRLPRWEGQDNYVELWVEKAALAGVLQPLAREFHVTLMVNRGYSSQSAMYESARRFLRADGQPILFYLGDHDPSGEDMVRDVRERLELFGVDGIDVQKLALTMEQVRRYNPPPNPAKRTDSRAAGYIAEHGSQSWEVDALNPATLAQIIRTAFEGVVDMEKMEVIKEREERHKTELRRAAKLIEQKDEDSDD